MKAFFFCIFLLCVLNVVRVESLCCGQVFDGPVYLQDIETTSTHHRVFASWTNFTGNCQIGSSSGTLPSLSVLGKSPPLPGITGKARSGTGAFGQKKFTTPGVTYQVAVISQSMATPAIRQSGWNTKAFSPRCRIASGIGKQKPDTADWKFTETQNTYINMSVKLYPGVRYFVIVRAHIQGTTGRTVYSNSNGFVPDPYGDGADDDDGQGDDGSNDDDGGDDDDTGNENDADNDGDDDGLAPYQSGLIAMGCALFCLLLLCCLLLLVFFTRKSEDKYTTTVHRNENVDKL